MRTMAHAEILASVRDLAEGERIELKLKGHWQPNGDCVFLKRTRTGISIRCLGRERKIAWADIEYIRKFT